MQNKIRLLCIALLAALLAGIGLGAAAACRGDVSALFVAARHSMDSPSMCLDSFLKALGHHAAAAALLWVCGTTVLGGLPTLFLSGARGFSIGYAVGALVHSFGLRGFFAAICGVFPHNLFYIPILGILALYALRFSLEKGNTRRGGLWHYSLTILLISLPLLFGCLVEGYISAPLLKSILGAHL